MFCSNCGAKAYEGDRFCPVCGARLKYIDRQTANNQTNNSEPAGSSAPQQQYRPTEPVYRPAAQTSGAGNPFARQEEKKTGAKKFRSMGAIIATLIVVVVLMLLFMGARGFMGDDMEDMLSSCAGCSGQSEPVEIGGAPGYNDVSGTDDSLPDIITTTSTTTTTTTEPTTTTTTVDARKIEAEEIRQMLVSRKWQTELEGYKATVTFKKDGTAAITVKVLFISKTIEAEYSVNDKCHAVIQTNYEGQTLGISGQISKVSSTKLLVERDKNMGEVYLTAA